MLHPSIGHGVVECTLWAAIGVLTSARAVDGNGIELFESGQDVPSGDVGQSEGAHPWGIDDPTAFGQRDRFSASRGMASSPSDVIDVASDPVDTRNQSIDEG